MRFSTAIFVFLIFAAAGSATAQRKTITNADLEKYRQARLTAEREYRENHVRLGMPSPEELERRNEQSRQELREMAAEIRQEERDRAQMAYEASAAPSPIIIVSSDRDGYQYGGIAPAVVTDFYRYGRDRRRGNYRQPYRQDYYVSGGSPWPNGPRTVSRPLIKVRTRNR